MRSLCCGSLAVVLVSTAAAGPIELQIDQTQSTADVELCLTILFTACDTDTTPVAESVTVSLDCPIAPGDISLHDFVFQLAEDVALNLSFGFGDFDSIGYDVEVTYADAGNPLPPVAVSDNAFAFTNVPAQVTGLLAYEATGLVCNAFSSYGYDCIGAIDLITIPLDPLDMDGTITVSGNDVTLTLDTFISAPVDPANPELGTFTIDATMLAGGVSPSLWPGDLTGDDRVDLADHGRFVGCLAGPGPAAIGACQCADLDEDDDVDLEDFAGFQVAFEGP
ncbi:MAG: hypothetical protein JSU86_14190 [Phycisphaerales bacterium]|nr:MAG: hypothetical protein JSU86_14190 [Phycisphaerales bacterium]